ncbi:Hpt domain-containing protein [Poriferisphaera sp. WC338]|uniref:Hpt domain-containing protein n=1 Tax=Poriferisphaera sp. WC338 TaxID=3425129 RepID=UPI003D8156C7
MIRKQSANEKRESRLSKARDGKKLYSTLPMKDAEARELVAFFVQEMRGHIEALQRGLDRLDFELLKTHAHQLRGAGGGYGFALVSEYGERLEMLIRCDCSVDEIVGAAEALLDVCRRVSLGGVTLESEA